MKKTKKFLVIALASVMLLGATLTPSGSVNAARSYWPYCFYNTSHGAMQQIQRANDCTNSWCKSATYYFKCSQCTCHSVVCLGCGQYY